MPTPASRLVAALVGLVVVPDEDGEGEREREPEGLRLPEPVEVAGREANETLLGLGVAVEEGDRDTIRQIINK